MGGQLGDTPTGIASKSTPERARVAQVVGGHGGVGGADDDDDDGLQARLDSLRKD